MGGCICICELNWSFSSGSIEYQESVSDYVRALKAVVIHSKPQANVKLCHPESEKMHIGFRGNLIFV